MNYIKKQIETINNLTKRLEMVKEESNRFFAYLGSPKFRGPLNNYVSTWEVERLLNTIADLANSEIEIEEI